MLVYVALYSVIGLGFAFWAGAVAKSKRDDVALYAVLGFVFGILGVLCSYLSSGGMEPLPHESKVGARCGACGAIR